MLIEIIRVITKTEESEDVTSQQVLTQAKSENTKSQFAILNSLNKTKYCKDKDSEKGTATNWGKTANTWPKHPWTRAAVIVVWAIHPDDAQLW